MTILTYYEYLRDRNCNHSSNSYKQYRKYYLRLYQRQRRKNRKEVTLLLSPDVHTRLKAGAIQHQQSLSKFIASAAIAYIDKKYVVPNEQVVSNILQTLSLTYSQVQYLADQTRKDNSNQLIEYCYALIIKLEKQLETLLRHPDSLETFIAKTLHSNPHYYRTLTSLLKTYDYQNQIN